LSLVSSEDAGGDSRLEIAHGAPFALDAVW
jgi:hypothetical protein